MSNVDGPPRPEEDPFFDYGSEENVRRGIEDTLSGLGDLNTLEISEEEFRSIKDFLVQFNVVDADGADIEDINFLWHLLLRSPSLIRDFTYYLITRKEAAHHSMYPLAISFQELLEYAQKIRAPQEIRPYLISLTSGSMKQVGFDAFQYSDRALSETKDPRVGPEAIRFLGWTLTLPFLGDISERRRQYLREHRINEFLIQDLATVVTVGVGNHLTKLERNTGAYLEDISTEREALERHQQMIIAMRGIYRMCGITFLDKGKPKSS